MTTPTVKPGTRCECRSANCGGSHGATSLDPCANDSVRMVTPEWYGNLWDKALGPIPMCAPCAEWHEKQAK